MEIKQSRNRKSKGLYRKYVKRPMDFILSLFTLIMLSPLLIILTVIGIIVMKGTPFFTQERPGLHEHIFTLIKFRTMDNKRDINGNLLPDVVRLNKYGRFLRITSLDELPELINLLKGDMSIVGPRPLLVKYIPYYSEEQHHRHDVRPGLTGNAQAHGRNSLDWDKKFQMDLDYIKHITFIGDVKIIFDTFKSILKQEGISQDGNATMEDFIDYISKKKEEKFDRKGYM